MTQPVALRSPPPPMWFIAMSAASSVMGLTLLAPALPLIQTEMSASNAAVQQLLTVYLIALAVGQLVYGTLSDRYGRRPILLFGAALFTIGGISAFFITSIETLTLFRALQGLGAAGCLAMGRAMINDCFDRNEAAKNMSTVASMIALVPMLALAFGGALVNSTGWQGVMAVTAISGFIVFMVCLLSVRETNLYRIPSIKLDKVVASYVTVLRDPVFFCFAMASGMQVGMFFAMNGLLPFQYHRLGYSPSEFGLWFSLTPLFYLIGNSVNRRYLISRGIERAAMLGSVLTVVAILAMLVTQALHMPHALSLAIPCSLFGFSNGIIVANSTIGAISAAGHHAGTGTGVTGAWQMAAGGIGGAIIVGLGGAQNFQIAAGGLLTMACIAVASMYYVYKRHVLAVAPS